MKKYFSYLVLLSFLVMTSCADDKYDAGKNEGMVDFSFKTTIPSAITTYAATAGNSHLGGAGNVDAMYYDLRYIMEVWTKEATPRLAYRAIESVTGNFTTQDVTFTARLLAMEYDVVFWADFVGKGATSDLYYKTDAGLTNIEMIAIPYAISQDARDAYYKAVPLDLTMGDYSTATNIELQRPFGKYRLVAIDAIDGSLSIDLTSAKIQYKDANAATFPAGFNALTGDVNSGATIDASALFTSDVLKGNVLAGGVTYNDVYVLAYDYLFAPPTRTVSFETTVSVGPNDVKRLVSSIPIQENKLTTVIGNFFTNTGTFKVIVSDPFEDELEINLNPAITINSQATPTYNTIQEALVAAVSGDVINLPGGFYDLGTGITIPAGITVQGAGRESTVLKAARATAGQTSVSLVGTLEGVSVVYDAPRLPNDAWNSENPVGVNMLAGSKLIDSRVKGHRNGVYVNNVSGYTIENNIIEGNRTGIQLANGTSGTIKGNTIQNNVTIGLLLQYLSDNSISAVPTVENNTFDGNWSSDVDNRWPTPYALDLETGNTFTNGTKTLAVAPNSGEMGSSVNFVKGDVTFKANVVTAVQSNVILSGTTLQNSILMGGIGYASLTTALAAATGGETIEFAAGTYAINTQVNINKSVTIKGAAVNASIIESSLTNDIILFVNAANVTIDGLAFKHTTNGTYTMIEIQAGISDATIQNSTFLGQYGALDGAISRAIISRNNVPNLSIIGNTFTNVRQPAYLQGSTTGGVISNNICNNTRGWVITSGTNFALSGNSFNNTGLFLTYTHIAIIANSEADNYPSVAAISAANNNCKVKNDVSGQSI